VHCIWGMKSAILDCFIMLSLLTHRGKLSNHLSVDCRHFWDCSLIISCNRLSVIKFAVKPDFKVLLNRHTITDQYVSWIYCGVFTP